MTDEIVSRGTALRNRVAIVTGAGNGIGRCIALAFLIGGAKVAIVDKNPASLRRIADARFADDDAFLLQADATAGDEVRSVVERTLQRYGHVDTLVNNVGGLVGDGSLEASRGDWDATLALTLTSQFLFCQAVAPSMIARGFGRIINIASNAGKYRGNTGVSGLSYATAKGGVLQMTRSLAHALGRHGVTVNAIAPGSVMTGAGASEAAQMPAELTERVIRETPLGYFAAPEEIASIALFLASRDASYITGAAIVANGGWCTS
jgi:3-oxoacyl-[acyl-carrier protein] reductase